MINLTESVMLDASSVRRTTDGYLVAQPRVARTGIQTYRGNEVGKPELDSVRVYRPEAEVFSDKTMRSATHRPVTIDHPPEMVSANNWRKYSRGQTGDEVHRDGKFIRVPMILMDSAAISEWDSGKKEISMGYTCDLAFEPGVTPEGEKYDAVQRNIRMNHLAIVGSARGGADLRLGDVGNPYHDPKTGEFTFSNNSNEGVARLWNPANSNKTLGERVDPKFLANFEAMRNRLIQEPRSIPIPPDVREASRQLGHLGFERSGEAVSAIRQDYETGGLDFVKSRWDIQPGDELNLQKIINHIKTTSFGDGWQEQEDQDVLDAHYVMCPECDGEVPEHAEFCPHCGHDMSTTDNEPMYDLDSLDSEMFDLYGGGNPNHVPKGQPGAGRFTFGGGSSGRAPRIGKTEKIANKAAELTKHGYYIGHAYVKGQKGGRYQVTHPDATKTGHIFENKESAIAHAESHARANKIGSFAHPEPSHEKHAMLTAAKELGGDLHEMFKGITGEGGKNLKHTPGMPIEFGQKKSIFANKALAKEHIRKQIRLWKQAKAVPGPTMHVPRRGVLGWIGATKRLKTGYRIHYPRIKDESPWQIVFDEALFYAPLTDADLVEVLDYNENHDPKTGEFTSGSMGLGIGPGRFTVGELMAASRREAASSTFSNQEFSKEHAAKQLETWKKYLATQEAALLEIKKQRALWEKAKIHPHYEILPKTSIFQLKTPKRVHYTVHIDSERVLGRGVPDVELTESDWIAAREIDAQMQIEARQAEDMNPYHDPHNGEFTSGGGGLGGHREYGPHLGSEEHGPEIFPMKLQNVLTEYTQGKHSAKQVQAILAEEGWKADLRGGSSQIQVWAPGGTGKVSWIQT